MSIKGTNVENIGSQQDHDLRVKAASTEKAWEVVNPPHEGLYIWRIEKFKVVAINSKDYGKFYNGDSYVILKTIKIISGVFDYNLHFWIGSKSSQDEYGTAAYKAVELDDLLKRLPHLYRETEMAMSDLFKSYFPQGLTILEGGVDTGFKHIPYDSQEMFFKHFKSLLYKIHNKNISILPYNRNSITEDDSFVIDTGKVIYIYNGKNASHTEIYESHILAENIRSARTVFKTKIDDKPDLQSIKNTIGADDIINNSIIIDHIEIPDALIGTKISDYSPYITEISLRNSLSGKLSKDSLCGVDSYIITYDNTKYIWIGKESNTMEANLAWDLAVRHISLDTQVSVEREGNESLAFKSLFN